MIPDADKPLAGLRILVAEDNAILAFNIISMLTRAGAEAVGPATSVAEAEGLARSGQLNCAILDISLRKELIFPAAEILRQNGTAIVFYTGYSELEFIKRDWPEARLLIKPVSPQIFLKTVKAACKLIA